MNNGMDIFAVERKKPGSSQGCCPMAVEFDFILIKRYSLSSQFKVLRSRLSFSVNTKG